MPRFSSPGKSFRLYWLIVILLAALVIFLRTIVDVGGNAQGPTTPTPVSQPMPSAATIALPDRSLLSEAMVVQVIDGDTIDVEIEGQVARVRYYGSDAPERGAPCADDATNRNRQLVEGQTVLLLPSDRDKDPGGRLLRYVFTIHGRLVDEVLISEGLARAWRRGGTYLDQLVAVETTTANAAVGCLWRR